MKLLYVASGHPLQEADDCLMWEKLGIEWFSTGYYATMNKPGDLPYIKVKHRSRYIPHFVGQKGVADVGDRSGTLGGKKNITWTGLPTRNIWNFTEDFIDQFDAVFFNHFISNVQRNIGVLEGKKIFLKTYAMHDLKGEFKIKHFRDHFGLKVIRNSPKEHLRANSRKEWGGLDAVIRGSVVRDENEISGWTGEKEQVCTFSSFLTEQGGDCYMRRRYYEFIKNQAPFPFLLNGVGNNFCSHEEKVRTLRESRVNLVVGTPKANNTYSMVEGWIMGQPLVIFGPQLWDSPTYECHELVDHGVNGFIGHSPKECVNYIRDLMHDKELAQQVGAAGREKALTIYGRETLSQKWRDLFIKEGLLP